MLDRILNKGVIVTGEVKISVANVDLIYLNLRVLVSFVDAALRNLEAGPTESP